MTEFLRVIGNNYELTESPFYRQVNLAYDKHKINKVFLEFNINVGGTNSYLAPDNPITINDKSVTISDLPNNSDALGLLNRKQIDITNLVKVDPKGANNDIRLYFVNKAKGFLSKRPAGSLSMVLTIVHDDEVVEKLVSTDRTEKHYCMYCGLNKPKIGTFCCYCGLEPPKGGLVPKQCRNCQHSIPKTAKYCDYCGNEQPMEVEENKDSMINEGGMQEKTRTDIDEGGSYSGIPSQV